MWIKNRLLSSFSRSDYIEIKGFRMVPTRLAINDLAKRHYGLTDEIANNYYQAACVCLDREHNPPQVFALKGDDFEKDTLIEWVPSDKRTKRAWANKDDATRDGAYACAIAAIELCYNLYTVGRSETLTGSDYYVSFDPNPPQDFENCLRLEVSGTDMDGYEVRRRLLNKIKQVKSGKSDLPAIAAVVGFRVKKILIKKVCEVI